MIIGRRPFVFIIVFFIFVIIVFILFLLVSAASMRRLSTPTCDLPTFVRIHRRESASA